MAHLISNLEKLNKEIGGNVFNKFLAANLFLDSPIMVIPYILQNRDKKYLLYREQELGNVGSIDISNLIEMPFKSYFLVSKDKELMAKNVFEKIEEILINEEIEDELQIDNNLPYNFYHELCLQLNKINILKEKENYPKKNTVVYSISTEKVMERFITHRQKAQTYAQRIILNSADRSVLEEGISNIEDSRFTLLSSIMKENNFSSVLISSKLNIQELTSLPIKSKSSRICAVYRKEDDKVFILSDCEIDDPRLNKIDIFSDYFQALKTIIDKNSTLGFEDHLVSVSEYDRFSERGFLLEKGTLAFRRWREYRAGEDLAFYIIAGKASNYAMENTLKEASSLINQSEYKSEKVLFQKYLDYFKEFKIIHNLPYHFSEYFTNFYASDRTLYPSVPSNFMVNKNTEEIKIDAGILLLDSQGLILGTSDIARTLPLSFQSNKIYELIKNTIKKYIIPNIKNVDTFEEIYYQGIKSFSENCEDIMKEYNLCPPSFSIIRDYNRDIGHLMGKQESFDEKIFKGHKNKLRNNFIGCIEVQWQYKKHALVYEDMWYIGEQKKIANITG